MRYIEIGKPSVNYADISLNPTYVMLKGSEIDGLLKYVISLQEFWGEDSIAIGRTSKRWRKSDCRAIAGFKSCPSNSAVFFVQEIFRWRIAAWCAAFFGNALSRMFLRSAGGACRLRAASSLWLYGSGLVGRKAGFWKSSEYSFASFLRTGTRTPMNTSPSPYWPAPVLKNLWLTAACLRLPRSLSRFWISATVMMNGWSLTLLCRFIRAK